MNTPEYRNGDNFYSNRLFFLKRAFKFLVLAPIWFMIFAALFVVTWGFALISLALVWIGCPAPSGQVFEEMHRILRTPMDAVLRDDSGASHTNHN